MSRWALAAMAAACCSAGASDTSIAVATVAREESSIVTASGADSLYARGSGAWRAGDYSTAEPILRTMVTSYPHHRRTSLAHYLLGRLYIATGQLPQAVAAFYHNYKQRPDGDHAADSLYYLGWVLTRLQRPRQACKSYDELDQAFGSGMGRPLRIKLAQGRIEAQCPHPGA